MRATSRKNPLVERSAVPAIQCFIVGFPVTVSTVQVRLSKLVMGSDSVGMFRPLRKLNLRLGAMYEIPGFLVGH